MRQDSNLRASRCKRDDVATCRYASWIKWRESNSRIFHGKESLCHWATLEFAALLTAVTLVLTSSVVYLHHVTQMANYLDLQWVGWNCQDACNNAIYWIRTNVSSIAASALTTKLNAQIVDTNVTLLYASLKINKIQVAKPLWFAALSSELRPHFFWRGRLDSNQRPTALNAKWTLLYGSYIGAPTGFCHRVYGLEGHHSASEL